jgi:hypothetical protein
MSMMSVSESFEEISKIYKTLSYIEQYAGSIFLFVLITFLLFLAVSYLYIIKNLSTIKENWAIEKCKVANIPFAGMINKPNDKTAFQYTEENFIECQQTLFITFFKYLTAPIQSLMNMLLSVFKELGDGINVLRIVMANLKNLVSNIIQSVVNTFQAIMIPFQQLIIVFHDTLGKFSGVLVAGLYVVISIYDTFVASIKVFIEGTLEILNMLALLIISLYFFVFTIPVAIAGTVAYLVVANPFRIVLQFMENVLGITPTRMMPKDPKQPKKSKIKVCFSGDTLITLLDNVKKEMRDIKVGDIIHDGSRVTTTMVLNRFHSHFYHNKTIQNLALTGEHKVFFEKENKWIPVKRHPEFQWVEKPDTLVFCLRTTSKRIKIDGYTFLDWDEVEDDTVASLWHRNTISKTDDSNKNTNKNTNTNTNKNKNKIQIVGKVVSLANKNEKSITKLLPLEQYNAYGENYILQLKHLIGKKI